MEYAGQLTFRRINRIDAITATGEPGRKGPNIAKPATSWLATIEPVLSLSLLLLHWHARERLPSNLVPRQLSAAVAQDHQQRASDAQYF